MATVFMKWLESSPQMYERGVRLLTLGRIDAVRDTIVRDYQVRGKRVLEIGCGPGTLAWRLAEAGGEVIAIDALEGMIEAANANERLVPGKVEFIHLDASQIVDRFADERFDLIVSSLVFSELTETQQQNVLEGCRTLLTDNGKVIIVDETIPNGKFARLLYWIVRVPLMLLTWLLTRTTTYPLDPSCLPFKHTGFQIARQRYWLGRSITLFEAIPIGDTTNHKIRVIPRLSKRKTAKGLLLDVWALFFRIVPPYPKVKPGLYQVGVPDKDSPVLVTGNYDLTVRRVVNAIDQKINCWLLVADSKGINVWCAAGGKFFTAEDVISVVKTSGVEEVVNHKALILPQLCANGVDGWKIRKETGWGVFWGPVRAADVPEYLEQGRKKSERMRAVEFPLKDRIEMVFAVAGFYTILLGILFALAWRPLFWTAMGVTFGLSLIYGIFLPVIPGKDGVGKGIFLTAITLVALWGFALVQDGWSFEAIFNHSLGWGFLAFFVGAEFQGMSPLMRGEQANWGIEATVGVVVLVVYFIPRLAGWW